MKESSEVAVGTSALWVISADVWGVSASAVNRGSGIVGELSGASLITGDENVELDEGVIPPPTGLTEIATDGSTTPIVKWTPCSDGPLEFVTLGIPDPVENEVMGVCGIFDGEGSKYLIDANGVQSIGIGVLARVDDTRGGKDNNGVMDQTSVEVAGAPTDSAGSMLTDIPLESEGGKDMLGLRDSKYGRAGVLEGMGNVGGGPENDGDMKTLQSTVLDEAGERVRV